MSEGGISDKDEERVGGVRESSDSDDGGCQEGPSNVAKAVGKRKRKSAARRRNIARLLSDSDLQADTLEARKEEDERRRRLSLQRSLHAESVGLGSTDRAVAIPDQDIEAVDVSALPDDPESSGVSPREVIVLDSSDDEQREPATKKRKKTRTSPDVDVIEIGSASSESDAERSSDDESAVWNGAHARDANGRVLVNVNHPADEEDIFLAPQIARIIKPHQVGCAGCLLSIAVKVQIE